MTAMLKQDLEATLNHPVDVVRLRDAMNTQLKARIEREATYVWRQLVGGIIANGLTAIPLRFIATGEAPIT